jgi:hypothetical protein
LPATLVTVAIDLFVAVALHSPAILVAIAIAITLLPLPSSSPATLTLPSLLPLQSSLAFFVTRQPHCRRHCPRRCHCPCCHCLPATVVALALFAVAIATILATAPTTDANDIASNIATDLTTDLATELVTKLATTANLATATATATAAVTTTTTVTAITTATDPPHRLPSLVDCCFSPPPWLGGGLGPSFAPPIQRTCPCRTSPGLRSCYHRNGYPCTRERPILAITLAKDVHKWGSTGEGWEGGYGVVWTDFCDVGHGCESDFESVGSVLL